MVMGNDPANMFDPDGGKEYSNTMKALEWLGLFELGEGDWYKSDRVDNTNQWKNANLYNTENGITGQYKGFDQIDSYYGWLNQELNNRGHEVKWSKGAKSLTNTLQYISFLQADYGLDKGSLIGLLTELNEAIVDYAIPNFGNLLKSVEPLKGKAAYDWDLALVKVEQGDVASKVYEKWYNYLPAKMMEAMIYSPAAKLGGIIPFGTFKDYKEWDIINDSQLRVDIPMLMLYPDTHKPIFEGKYLNSEGLLKKEYLEIVLQYHIK